VLRVMGKRGYGNIDRVLRHERIAVVCAYVKSASEHPKPPLFDEQANQGNQFNSFPES
jgi:hypothetical protein